MKNVFLSLAAMTLLAGSTSSLHAATGPQAGQQPRPASAQTSKPRPPAQSKPAAVQPHSVNAEFVSYNASAKTMTLKDDKGQTSTASVEGQAIKQVTQLRLKSGDHVMLTFRDNTKGEHQAITNIQAAKSKA